MKKLLFFALLLPVVLISQPVLQEPTFMPIGFNATMHFSGSVTPGPAGANQTWNFSGLTYTTIGLTSVVNPSATPCSSLYPTSNYAWVIPGPKYRYHNRTSTKIEIMSNDLVSSCSPNGPYSDYMQVFQFPFNYLQSFSDPFQQGATSGTATTTYDAYGTLMTPFGTYSNTIRFTDGANQRFWIATGNPSYVVMMAFSGTTVFFSNPSVLSVDEMAKKPELDIYPNPTTGTFYLNTSSIDKASDLNIYNSTGELIYTSKINEAKTEINLSNKARGIYFVQISNGKSSLNKKIILD